MNIAHIDIEQIARICHETNRVYCESIGDNSQKIWNEAEEWQRDSAINGVKYKLKHPDATPKDQHDVWSLDKINSGWTYGTVKDADKKTHPCLVPYEQLPAEQKIKDYLFVGVVKAFQLAS